MCGIAGWVDFERDLRHEEATVRAMGETLVCRGPDAAGAWLTKSAAFAHRRLIVVDPEGGIQPMTRRLGGKVYTITYNGELYNTEDIRKELLHHGHTFQSYSDTEVLLLSYAQWGTACVDKLNGIFAFGIWDESERRLFLGRDRLGVKPLFYARKGSSVVFGSEIKALLAHPDIDATVDMAGLAEIFSIGPARTPGVGVFKDISELRAGHTLVVTANTLHHQAYWKLESREHTDSELQTVETVRDLLVDTVERQLFSDVPVCTFLSGGLDSSAVSAIAAQFYARNGRNGSDFHTYSIDFEDMAEHFQANSFQTSLDGPWAKRVAEHIGSTHHPVIFGMETMNNHLMTPLKARDLPGMADIDTSLFLFCQEVKKYATVALSGESADEVFGGYPWFHRAESLNAETFPWSLKLHERVPMMSAELRNAVNPYDYVGDRYAEALAEVPRLPGEAATDARIREISYLSITRFLPTLLDRKDRMSMATGLEVRVPFCDHRLVDYVFNIPWSIKTLDGHSKGVLRRAMKDYLPEDALYRKKSPYPSMPDPLYLETTRRLAIDMLSDASSPILPLIDPAAIRGLAEASYKKLGHRPWFGQIMGTPQMFHYLLQVNTWLKEYHVQLV